MTDRPVLEAVGEVLAELDGVLDQFKRGRDKPAAPAGIYRRYFEDYMELAANAVALLKARGYALSPTPIVNAGEER